MSSSKTELRTMGQRMEAILNDNIPDISHDVTFIVGEEKVKISCHKLFLMAASPVFKAMFSERHSVQNISGGSGIFHSNSPIKSLTNVQINEKSEDDQLSILIPDVSPTGLKNLIKYVYSHNLNVDVNDALATMYAAHKYDIQELFEHCGKVLHSKMSIENVVTCYQAALLLNDVQLRKNAWSYIQLNAGKLLESKQFLEFSEDNLCKFLKLDQMPTVASEVAVFKGVLKWGNNQCKMEKKTMSKENVKAMLKKAIPLIRFPTMGHLDIMDIVEPSGMLTESECCKLYKYFLLSGPRKMLLAKTLDYSLEKRNGCRFVLCPTAPTHKFTVVNSNAGDSFIVTGNTGNVKLNAVGIVLPHTYANLSDVLVNISIYDTSLGTKTNARKKVLKYLEIFYVEFENPVNIRPNVEYEISVNTNAQGNGISPGVSFVKYTNELMKTATRIWTMPDKRQLTMNFYPSSYVIWALKFSNSINYCLSTYHK